MVLANWQKFRCSLTKKFRNNSLHDLGQWQQKKTVNKFEQTSTISAQNEHQFHYSMAVQTSLSIHS